MSASDCPDRPERKVSQWGDSYWEVPHAFRDEVGRVEIGEDGEIHILGVPNPVRDLLTARRLTLALEEAVNYGWKP